ncbi:hypothetical protein [Arcanobacterium hippocoleae]|uniref:hypothetical protein n=1 Tax=Arcanobacterium hippocoleae TaxID=149017 RepID=UPI003340754F
MKVKIGKNTIAIMSSVAILASGITIGLSGNIATAANRDDLVAREKAQASEIEKLKSQITGLDVNVQETFLKLTETKNKIPGAESELANAQSQLSAAEREAQRNAAVLLLRKPNFAKSKTRKKQLLTRKTTP